MPYLAFDTEAEARAWLAAMSRKLAKRMPDRAAREEFLVTVHYEAKRAGLDPQLVLGLIQVESDFRKYAVSTAGARGYMQVMPFWVKLIGSERDHNLFHLRTNLRYGCVILRHYLDIENGDLFRALGRYNGSLGRAEYPEHGGARLAARLELRRAASRRRPLIRSRLLGGAGLGDSVVPLRSGARQTGRRLLEQRSSSDRLRFSRMPRREPERELIEPWPDWRGGRPASARNTNSW